MFFSFFLTMILSDFGWFSGGENNTWLAKSNFGATAQLWGGVLDMMASLWGLVDNVLFLPMKFCCNGMVMVSLVARQGR